MKRWKLLLLHKSLSPGGIESVLLDLVRYIDKRAFDVTVCYLRDDVANAHDLVDDFRTAGAKVIALHGTSKFDIHVLMRLRSTFESIRPDILHTFMAYPGIWGRLIGRLVGIPIIISSLQNVANRTALWVRVIDKMTFPLADVLVACSTSVEESYFGNSAVFNGDFQANRSHYTIYNSVDVAKLDRMLKSANCEAVRKEFGLDRNSPLLVNVGRIDPQKGQIYLIEAMQYVIKSQPQAKLLIVGQTNVPTLENKLKKRVKQLGLENSVIFTGLRRDVMYLVKAADIFVMSSIHEGFSLAILEAMAVQKAIVAFDIPGVREAIIDGRTGVLVRCRDSVALAKAIINLLDDPAQREKLGYEARKRVEEQFDAQRMVDRYEALYETLIRAKAG